MEIVAENSLKSLCAFICVCSDHLRHVMSAEKPLVAVIILQQ